MFMIALYIHGSIE